jgi:hypothetical protein
VRFAEGLSKEEIYKGPGLEAALGLCSIKGIISAMFSSTQLIKSSAKNSWAIDKHVARYF